MQTVPIRRCRKGFTFVFAYNCYVKVSQQFYCPQQKHGFRCHTDKVSLCSKQLLQALATGLGFYMFPPTQTANVIMAYQVQMIVRYRNNKVFRDINILCFIKTLA
jgi:hypothetical protein